jgi:hypothetical protein
MTDATGRSFLSYRRARLDEARRLIEAQHEIGIPTWHDLRNLDEKHTDTELRRVLDDPFTASAVVWLTPDVANSHTIQRTELPKILDREARSDGFFAVPVAAGGLRPEQADAVAGNYLGTRNLKHWNLPKVDADPVGADEAATVADRVLQRRIRAVHTQLAADAPLLITLYTRETPPIVPGTALAIDWSQHFAPRDAPQTVWDATLLPALRRISEACKADAPGRTIIAGGKCEIPAAVALGTIYLAPRGLPIVWRQFKAGRPAQDWSLDTAAEPCGFTATLENNDVAGDDIAVLISVASDVTPAFGASRSRLPAFRGHVAVTRPGDPPHDLATPGQVRDLVCIVLAALHRARTEWQAPGTLHLFMAVPLGFAMLLGQMLNTLGPVQTYRHDATTGAVGEYRPAVLLFPSA